MERDDARWWTRACRGRRPPPAGRAPARGRRARVQRARWRGVGSRFGRFPVAMSVPVHRRGRPIRPDSAGSPAGLPRRVARRRTCAYMVDSGGLHARIAWGWVGRTLERRVIRPRRSRLPPLGVGHARCSSSAHSGVTTTARTQRPASWCRRSSSPPRGPALAFHSGGVADCEGCHSMHNSIGGSHRAWRPALGLVPAAPERTRARSASTATRRPGCPAPRVHFVSTSTPTSTAGKAPRQLTPGGDFGWLKKTYTWTPAQGAAPLTSPGERHGHNVVAVRVRLPGRRRPRHGPGRYLPQRQPRLRELPRPARALPAPRRREHRHHRRAHRRQRLLRRQPRPGRRARGRWAPTACSAASATAPRRCPPALAFASRPPDAVSPQRLQPRRRP